MRAPSAPSRCTASACTPAAASTLAMFSKPARSGTPPSTGTQQTGLRHDRKRRRRVPRQQELEQFHPHPLARQLPETRARGDAGGKPRGIGQSVAIGGMETEEAQDAQIILGDAFSRVADEAHAPRFEIREPADIIVHDAVGGRPRARSW